MSWEIISGLIVIATFLITFMKYCGEQTKTLQKLGDSFDNLTDTFKEFKDEFKSVKDQVIDHEIRLSKNDM